MNPTVTAAIRTELLADEGKRLKVYDDATGRPIARGSVVVGNPSIGIGRNLAGRGITDDEAEYLLANDTSAAEADLTPLLPWLAGETPNRQAAVYCLYFNLDEGNPQRFLATWPMFLRQMSQGQYDAAADNLSRSEPWASQVGAGRVGRMVTLVRYG